MSTYLKGNGTIYPPDLQTLNQDTVNSFFNTGFATGWHVVGSCAMFPRDKGESGGCPVEGLWDEEREGGGCWCGAIACEGEYGKFGVCDCGEGADLIKEDLLGGKPATNGSTGSNTTAPIAFTGAASSLSDTQSVVSLLLVVVLSVVIAWA